MRSNIYTLKVLLVDLVLIEFGPLVAFFFAYYAIGFARAALALAAASVLSMLASLIIYKRVPWFAALAGLATIIAAFAAYWYDSPSVLVLTDSIFYFSLAIAFAFSILLDHSFLRLLFGRIISLNARVWNLMELRLFLFLATSGVGNEIVRVYFTTDDWVLYKQYVFVFGGLVCLYHARMIFQHGAEKVQTATLA